MRRFNKRSLGAKVVGALSIAFITTSMCLPTLAQEQMQPPAQISGVTMSIFPVARGADGQQYITTKQGFKVTVPGLGIAPDANEIAVYRNEANQFWYIDKNGVTQPVSESQLQWTMAQINQQQTLRSMQSGGAGMQLATPAEMSPGRMPTSPNAASSLAPRSSSSAARSALTWPIDMP